MVSIRYAHEDEAEAIAEIGLRAWEDAMSAVGETATMIETAYDAFVNFTYSSWLTILVIENGGTLLGWSARELLDDTITDFWIDPAHTRQGLGSALLAEVEAEIVKQGFEQATLQTHAANARAVKFFEAHGYAINWLSVVYSPKLDRDIQSVGLSKQLVAHVPDTYGPDF